MIFPISKRDPPGRGVRPPAPPPACLHMHHLLKHSPCWLPSLLLTFGLLFGPSQPSQAARVGVGVLAFMGKGSAEVAWAPMLQQLAQQLPQHRFELLPLDRDAINTHARRLDIDFILTNPGHYIELENELGASRILTLSAGPGRAERAIGSAVIVPRNSPLTHLDELKDARIALVSREGFAGYRLLWRELRTAGHDPQKSFGTWIELGFPMHQVFDAVLDGQADAGVVRSCLLESMPQHAQQLRVLAPRHEPDHPCATTTRLYPDWPLATLPHTSATLAREVAVALLSIPANPDGPTWSVPADYQAVHELFRELQIGPYAHLQVPTLHALVQRYRSWIITALAALLLWLAYTLRVEQRVRQRTRALHAALDERLALEKRVRESQEQAEHLSRLSVLGELSATLAHELNQPLSTIGNYAQSVLLRADRQTLTAEASREAAREIAQQAEHAAAVLSRIRSFVRKRSSQRELHNPLQVAEEAVALFHSMLTQPPPIALHSFLPAGLQLSMDALQIQQLLLNLLKNGHDASHQQAPEQQGLDVSLRLSGHSLQISVRDHGNGLDPELSGRLFEAFLSTKPDGLGLGLSICRSIAEAHGGRLEGHPAPDGPGMIFTLHLPIDD